MVPQPNSPQESPTTSTFPAEATAVAAATKVAPVHRTVLALIIADFVDRCVRVCNFLPLIT